MHLGVDEHQPPFGSAAQQEPADGQREGGKVRGRRPARRRGRLLVRRVHLAQEAQRKVQRRGAATAVRSAVVALLDAAIPPKRNSRRAP